MMEIINLLFDSDYFAWLLDVAAAACVFGAIVPVAFWGLGAVADAFFKWVRS